MNQVKDILILLLVVVALLAASLITIKPFKQPEHEVLSMLDSLRQQKIHGMPMHTNGIILRRHANEEGTFDTASHIQTNVPWTVIRHSPDGFNWGYNGSGPADLALNILQATLMMMEYVGFIITPKQPTGSNIEQWDYTIWGCCYYAIVKDGLYQEFKKQFIQTLSNPISQTKQTQTFRIDYEDVVHFIKEHIDFADPCIPNWASYQDLELDDDEETEEVA